MDFELYRHNIFVKPGRSGIFSRGLYYAFFLVMRRVAGAGPISGLLRSAGLVCIMIFIPAILSTATILDPALVYMDEGYEIPSEIHAQNTEGKFIPVAEFYRYSRRPIRLQDPRQGGYKSRVARAFLATEDNTFRYHIGVDLHGIIRASAVNLLAGRIKEGASTITQQAARLRFLSNERSMVRKLREAILAVLMELKYSKLKILEIYLNEVPLGHGTKGVGAAARFYFDKKAANLNWGEAALLASLTTRPRDFSPLRNIEESRKKVRVVLRKLIESGDLSVAEAIAEYSDLEKKYYQMLNRSPNESAFHKRLNRFPYVTEYVRYILPRRFRKRLYTGGLQIYTTIQIAHQDAAQKLFISHLKKASRDRYRPPFRRFEVFDEDMSLSYGILRQLFGLPEFRIKMGRNERRFQRTFVHSMRAEFSVLNLLVGTKRIAQGLDYHYSQESSQIEKQSEIEGSLVSLRPFSGEITALIGGSGFVSGNQLLRFIMSRRPPGSSFKPILYASGIEYTARHPKEKGLKPLTAATVIDDSPPHFVNRDLSIYDPENYTHSYDGPIRLRRGLALSKNIVAVKVYDRMKPRRINPIAESILGLDERRPPRRLPEEATVALGSQEFSTMTMARAYSVFASAGRSLRPHVLLYITDSHGNILQDYRKSHAMYKSRQIISPGTAHIVTDMMMHAVASGTGRAALLRGRQTAGKTGTTNRYRDAWFVGFTPRLVTAIHIGYDRARTLGRGGAGGNITAPIWRRYMQAALSDEPVGHFNFSKSKAFRLSVCALSGQRPGPRCTKRVNELFLPGTAPKKVCQEHGGPGNRDPMRSNRGDIDLLQKDF